jgi:hypothetical protein
MSEPRHTNRLIGETSPYLLQHAHNPVDWYPWGAEALGLAKAEGKPILLSVGYSACHWCHVMERESFENEETAALMNAHFVNIKVDREERPDIDHIYMSAVQMLAGQGGWPMTVFLTPDGKPFYGGTYYPPEDRYGRPGFPRILQAVAEAWRERREQIEQQSEEILRHLKEMSALNLSARAATEEIFDRACQQLRMSFDRRLGGFGDAPKFPQPMILDFLLRYAVRTQEREPLEMALFTLEKMAFGGIYDQLGGGFHRYSTDSYWLVPHFEKMLYDNAQLALTCLRAYQITGDAFYRRIVEETLDYVRREMTAPFGGFYSAQDADSEGGEGRFFVWTEEEIKTILGSDDAALFCRYYDVTPRGNWEHKNILNVTAPPDAFARAVRMEPEAFLERLEAMREKLFAEREKRVKPARDEKILVSWNGLMLAAFADAGAVLRRADYLQTAVNNAEFVLREMYRAPDAGEAARLMHTGKEVSIEEPIHPTQRAAAFRVAPIPGFLEDYAAYADGLLRLYEATFDRRWLEAARALGDAILERFADPNGGFFSTAIDAEALIERPKDIMDNAVPSGNSVALEALLRLAILTGEERYRGPAAYALQQLGEMAAQHPQAFGRLLCALDLLVGPSQELAIIGAREDPGTQALLAVARDNYYPNLLLALSDPSDPSPDYLPLLEARPMQDGKPTAYLCENYACRQPTDDPQTLLAQLRAGR